MDQEQNSISIQLLREENHQLKNQISEMKNAFDLNRDILAILSAANKNNNVEVKIFYQIIRRLTFLNNQTMLIFGDLISEKSKIKAQNFELKKQNEQLNFTVQQLLNSSKQQNKIRETHLEMRQQRALLRKELLNMNKQLVLKQEDIKVYKKILQQKGLQISSNEFTSSKIENNFEKHALNKANTNETKSKIDKNLSNQLHIEYLQQKNKYLTQHIEQLQGRIYILAKCVELQYKNTTHVQKKQDLLLNLMNYAIQNLKLGSLENQQQESYVYKNKLIRKSLKTKKRISKSLGRL